MLDSTIAPAVSAALLRICARNAFFGALVLFARFKSSAHIPTAATDGRDVFINTAYFGRLETAEQEGVLLHEVLHAALLHVPRRAGRDPQLWNVAADIVVNGMVTAAGYRLPQGALRDPRREDLGVEEVYELLLQEQPPAPDPAWNDLLGQAPADAASGEGESEQDAAGLPGSQRAALERYWRQARQQAQNAATQQHGLLPAGLAREFGMLDPSRLDWRSLLWRHLVRSPVDFSGFDRRFVGQGLYLDALDGEILRVAVAVDTSGSVGQEELDMFLSEVRGILRVYPHLRCDLYYADTELHGPHRLSPHRAPPAPVGGGGTDFRPFLERLGGRQRPAVAVYLTDGYGEFPTQPPPCPLLWVVTPGGLAEDAFPFGQAVRLGK
ncbi:MAG TPA: VWA-like domain-containing protein [Roseiflexaceae bacterium]|nr:VWA-like domain-containing protein [Roseiflexaceae bacterium]